MKVNPKTRRQTSTTTINIKESKMLTDWKQRRSDMSFDEKKSKITTANL